MSIHAAPRPIAAPNTQPLGIRAWLEVGVVSLLALTINIPYIGHPPRYDELYHILAAQSWAENGTFQIAEGTYTRAAIFTVVTGYIFRLFGYSIEAARIVPILASAALTGLVFAWTRAVVGRHAAWIASMLLAFSVTTMMMSQFARFYSIHALLFFLGSIFLFYVVQRGPRTNCRAIGAMLVFAGSMLLALHFQFTTLIGVAALAAWALACMLAPAWCRLSPRRRFAAPALAAAAACLVIGTIYYRSSLLDPLLATFRFQAFWAQNSSPLTYHWWLVANYPVFYGLLPAILVVALSRNALATTFCSITFLLAMLIHSFGGMRGEHYVFYLSPFFFILCAIAITAAPAGLQSAVSSAYSAVFSRTPAQRELHLLTNLLTVALAMFVVACTPAIYRSLKTLAVGPYNLHPQFSVDWRASRPALTKLATESDVVVTTNSLAALNYLGRHDVEFSATILYEIDPGTEFSLDYRTGLPVISTAQSLALLIKCYRSGLLITEAWQWKHPIYGFNPESASLIESRTFPIVLPEQSNLLAFHWENQDARLTPDCPVIRQYHRQPRG